ncbi:FG-GAP-like repeat-containing protein [Hymenobacter terrenus]|uniref:FG-GAP-like repeat-containing protein n=1 Tax=Hymenobacter terrenus TaxID=1629124 RepID=UPI00061A08E0|nr:FG-GAP-like repeat-containing protein [Hymenobacter terrenus]
MKTTILHASRLLSGLLLLASVPAVAQFQPVGGTPLTTAANLNNGAAWADVDQDGDLDLFVANNGDPNQYFRNDGNGPFVPVTTGLLATDAPASNLGAYWADYDNDGDVDLFVPNGPDAGRNALYRNDGPAGFARVTAAPFGTDQAWSVGAAWGDYDNDGLLDLFVANADDTPNFLYHNLGGGAFAKITTGPVVTDATTSYAGTWVDYDNDGDVDLFVTNGLGQTPTGYAAQNNALYRNDGAAGFTKITAGPLVSDGGNSIGATWADFDQDGDQDVFVANDTNFITSNNDNFYYRNDGGGAFTRLTGSPLGGGGDSFGSAASDVDNDGDPDLLVSNWGRNFLYRNDGTGAFTRVLGLAFADTVANKMGLALGDYNNDGYEDVYNVGAFAEDLLFRNTGGPNRYVKVRIAVPGVNRGGIGAVLRLKVNGRWQQRTVMSTNGAYCGTALETVFGTGAALTADSLTVTWRPGQPGAELANLATNQTYTITGGTALGTRAATNAPAWELYPNPATDRVTLRPAAGARPAASLELRDALGRVQRRFSWSAASPALDLRGLPAGLYFLHDPARANQRPQRLLVRR